MDRLLTITQAAARLGIEQKTLRRWADAGKVPCVRTLSGQRRFEPAVIERIRKEMGFTDEHESAEMSARDAVQSDHG
jgi:excisionase family DNA binding protein